MRFRKEMLKLYAVTERSGLPEGMTLPEAVREAAEGGATMVQLREKNADLKEVKKLAVEVRDVCREYNIPFIVNDDVDLAREIDADGVHVGQEDAAASEARRILGPEKIVGVTARTPEQIRKAEEDGADYIGSGAVFGTTTKKDAKPMSMEEFRKITEISAIPVVAIGGISLENAEKLKGSGAAGMAVVSALFSQKDIRSAAEALSRIDL